MEEPSVHLTCPWAMKWTGTVAQLEFGSNSAIKLFTWQNAEFNNNNFRYEFKPLFEYSQNIVLIFINVRNVLLHNNYSRISDAKTSCCRNLEKTWQYIRSGMLRSYLVQKKSNQGRFQNWIISSFHISLAFGMGVFQMIYYFLLSTT